MARWTALYPTGSRNVDKRAVEFFSGNENDIGNASQIALYFGSNVLVRQNEIVNTWRDLVEVMCESNLIDPANADYLFFGRNLNDPKSATVSAATGSGFTDDEDIWIGIGPNASDNPGDVIMLRNGFERLIEAAMELPLKKR